MAQVPPPAMTAIKFMGLGLEIGRHTIVSLAKLPIQLGSTIYEISSECVIMTESCDQNI
jgi:hypothetical protein